MIAERKDIEKVEKVNELISGLKRKLDTRDYYIKEVDGIKYVSTTISGVNIHLSDIKTNGKDGYFSHKIQGKFNPPFIVLYNSKFRRNRIGFDENGMAHELQHYLDWNTGMMQKPTKNLLLPQGGINPEYWRSDTEWNAYVIQNLREYFQKVELKRLPEDFKTFFKDLFRKTEAKRYYKNLNPEYKQRFMKRIYQFHQKLLERKHALKEGVGDKYAEKAFNIPNTDVEFEDRYQQHVMSQRKDPENGELVGHVMSGDPYENEDPVPVNIYKNPKSLKNFGNYVRAIGDTNGNIYVAQINGDFMHGEMRTALRMNNADTTEFYRDGNSNRFGVSGTFVYKLTKSYMDLSSEQIIKLVRNNKPLQNIFKRLNKRNPQFEFSYLPQHQFSKLSNGDYVYSVLNEQQQMYSIPQLAGLMGSRMKHDANTVQIYIQMLLDAYKEGGDDAVVNLYTKMSGVEIEAVSRGRYMFANLGGGGEDMLEGTGDKYAQKAFGIPDEQQQDYLKQTQPAVSNKEMGQIVGITTNEYEDARLSAIYKNPQSLQNFEKDVRAVSDREGNLYVAQVDGNFVHAGFNNVLRGNANNSKDFMTWMRLGNTNRFAYSDSFMAYAQQIQNQEDIVQRLKVLEAKHPEFEFIPKFYYFAEDDL